MYRLASVPSLPQKLHAHGVNSPGMRRTHFIYECSVRRSRADESAPAKCTRAYLRRSNVLRSFNLSNYEPSVRGETRRTHTRNLLKLWTVCTRYILFMQERKPSSLSITVAFFTLPIERDQLIVELIVNV